MQAVCAEQQLTRVVYNCPAGRGVHESRNICAQAGDENGMLCEKAMGAMEAESRVAHLGDLRHQAEVQQGQLAGMWPLSHLEEVAGVWVAVKETNIKQLYKEGLLAHSDESSHLQKDVNTHGDCFEECCTLK